MKRVVAAVQLVAALCAVAFVVLLFANEPSDTSAGRVATPAGTADDDGDGARVFAESCAGCHGRDGGGGVGPQLSEGRAVDRFPDIEDQIEVITSGRGGMPAFGDRLSEEEIRAVAEHVRSL